MREIEIANSSPVLIVAELSCNHNQNYNIAVDTIKAMKKAGADAVKLQTYTPETITFNSDKKYFQIKQGTIWDGTTLNKLYQKAYTPWEWHPKLKKLAERLGLLLFSSPFDKTAIDFLEKMNVPAYKIASFEITDIPLIEYAASKGKPMIISTGIAELKDIKEAIDACRRVGNSNITILKCTSEYPAPYKDINLVTMPDIKKRFKVMVGLSDHSLGISVPIAAVALGAKVVEKHFILDREKIGGPDSKFSLEPKEFKEMVQNIRQVEDALGTVNYKLSSPNLKKSREFSRSLFVVKDVKKGEEFTEENVRSIRPAFGMHTKYYKRILGKKATEDIEAGEPLKKSMIGSFK